MKPPLRWAMLARARVMRSLSAKFTLFYAALFTAAIALILIGARAGIERYAERIVGAEMGTGSAIFDRIAQLRTSQLGDAGRVLAADFGFRTAVASQDGPTIASALDSLRTRLGLSQAFFVGLDGSAIGYAGPLSKSDNDRLFAALDGGAESGIFRMAQGPYTMVAVPVRAPVDLGWVVFANALDARELASLSRLSAIALKPRLVLASTLPSDIKVAPAGTVPPAERIVNGERMLFQAYPIKAFGPIDGQVLLLEYSLTRALAEYTPMFWLLGAAGLLGVLLSVAGSWWLSLRLTRPIIDLDKAAGKISLGEYTQVLVHTDDELGALAQSFNRMVDDIGERERQIAHMAFHDSLTGLGNRALLREHLGLAIGRHERDRAPALVCIDLDNFKTVNDTLGHPTGDALLCEIATRLTAQCAEGFVARLGGDEFAIVLSSEKRNLNRIADDLIAALSTPCVVNGHRIVPGASMGIAIAGQDGDDPTTLLKNADLALYRAKSQGKGGYSYFEPALDAEAQKRRQMELDLHDALSRGELSLMFQPLFNLAQGRVSAFEALLRWQHPVHGAISPVDFIPLAEETGLILPIGEWVLREACRVAAQWPDQIRVAVNVSAVQFRSPGLNAVVLQALADSGVAPDRLELEITESLFIDNVEATLAMLHSLRAIGVRVALDDFGTGYSSLSYLRSFPFDKIKIDRSFIIDLLSNEGATAIIRSITTLAEALGMETTAEGVESVEQLDILREQGCSQIQGFYFSKPIRADAITALLRGGGDASGEVLAA